MKPKKRETEELEELDFDDSVEVLRRVRLDNDEDDSGYRDGDGWMARYWGALDD